MDPNECMHHLNEHLSARNWDEAEWAASDLVDWLEDGGFPPNDKKVRVDLALVGDMDLARWVLRLRVLLAQHPPKVPRMMPGQTTYTEEEQAALQSLIDKAAREEEEEYRSREATRPRTYLVLLGLNGRTRARVKATSFEQAATKAAKACERERQYGMAGDWPTTAIVTRVEGCPMGAEIGASQEFEVRGKVTTEYFAKRRKK